VVISFHSLEDRIVKTFIARESREVVDRRAPLAPPQADAAARWARIKPGAARSGGQPARALGRAARGRTHGGGAAAERPLDGDGTASAARPASGRRA
jgi:16S rRNA (cytosine1402-N4)-methyltransferase